MTSFIRSFTLSWAVGRKFSSKYGFSPGVCVVSRKICGATDFGRRRAYVIEALNVEEADTENTAPPSSTQTAFIKVERFATGAAYIGFISFALFLAPGSLSSTGEIGRILSGNVDDVNDLFFAIFCLLGTLSINMAVLLNPGAGAQKRLSTAVFSLLGVFFGFGALGPYLLGREYAPSVYTQDISKRGIFARLLESRFFSTGTLIFTLWTYAFALGAFTPGTAEVHDVLFFASYKGLERLLSADRFVCVSTLDGLLLSILTWGPLTEDMRRRGWFVTGKVLESILTALSILSTPGLGVALYLILRPRLPRKLNQS
ncbi:unnamed protein product [Agarophyton chilense]